MMMSFETSILNVSQRPTVRPLAVVQPPLPLCIGELRATAGTLAGARRGDVVDTVADSDGRLSIVVVDATRNAERGEAIADAVRSDLVERLGRGVSIARAMEQVEAGLFCEHADATVALAILRFDPIGGDVEILNAGLPPIGVLREGEGATFVPPCCFGAGLLRAVTYSVERVPMKRGTTFLLATHGLVGDGGGADEIRAVMSRLGVETFGTRIASASPRQLRFLLAEHNAASGRCERRDATVVAAALCAA